MRLGLTVKPDEGKLMFDFSESDSQADFINVPLGRTWSSVGAALLWALPPGTPRNEGLFHCVEIITEEGTALSPECPATTSFQAVCLGMEITGCVQNTGKSRW